MYSISYFRYWTDNKGRVVNFKNTIIIMTSNMGSAYIQSQMEKLNGANKEQVIEETKKEVMNMLKKTIRPEFLNLSLIHI